MMWTKARHSETARRGAWGVASQGLNSGGNLLLALFVARASTPEQFGAWSLAYVGYMVALHIARAAASMPMILERDETDVRYRDSGGFSTACVIGLLAGGCLILFGLAYAPLRPVIWPFAAFIPALLAHDALRYIFFRRRKPKAAAITDFAWFLTQVSGFAILVLTESDNAVMITAVWGTGALLAAVGGIIAAHVRPSFRSAREFSRSHRWASTRLLADSVLVTSSTHALPVILAATSGLGAAAGLRGGLTLLGGLNMVVLGLTPVMTVEAIRALRIGRSGAGLVGQWTLVLFVLAGTYGVLLLLVPDSIGRELLGENWVLAEPLLLPLVIQGLLRGPLTGVPILLKARYQLNAAVRLRLAMSVPSLACPAVGAVASGAIGAAWGIVAGAVLVNVQCLWALRRDRK